MNKSSRQIFAATLIALFACVTPGFAAAQATVQTLQVLPPGGSGCSALPLQGVTAHVLDGALHSFDVTLGDASYVAVLAQVGNEAIPFRYMTRFNHGSGIVRTHVDLNTTPINGSLPVSMTFLSSPVGQPTCLSIVSFSVSPSGVVSGNTSVPAMTIPAISNPTSGGTSGTTGDKAVVRPRPTTSTGSGTGKVTTVASTSATTTVLGTVDKSTGWASRIQAMCAGNGAFQLWFLLLAVYIVLVALTALARPPLAQRSVAIPMTLILAPLFVLLSFWYLVPICRAAGWIPAIAILAAIAGLLVAFREQNPGIRVISLPAAKPMNPMAVNKPQVPAVAVKPVNPAVLQKPQTAVVQTSQKPEQPRK